MAKEIPFKTKPMIQNIVACGRFSKEIDIREAYEKINFPKKEYEPETYCGLLVKVKVNGELKHVTLYKNGKFIIAGANSLEELDAVYKEITRILKQHHFL